MLNPDKSIFDAPAAPRRTNGKQSSAREVKRLANSLLPPLGANIRAQQNYRKMARMLGSLAISPKVLVLGGATAGSGFESLLEFQDIELVETDVCLGPRTALVCDAHEIPFESGTFDGVIVQAVLEHVVEPERCTEEVYRVLRPKGLVYADTPFIQQVHGGAHDFTRFTHLGHRRLFRRFEEVSSGVSCGPATALAWAYQHFLLSFARSQPSRAAAIAFARLTGFWLKYFDYILADRPGALDAASAYYFLGMKSVRSLSDRELLRQYRGLQWS